MRSKSIRFPVTLKVRKAVCMSVEASYEVAPEQIALDQPEYTATDRFMRKLLFIKDQPVDPGATAKAHKAFRTSLVVTAIRCLITYLAVPILIPLLALSGTIAGPISIALCLFAIVNGIISVRRFWQANHSKRWMYTAFMGLVMVVLVLAIIIDIRKMVGIA